MQKTNRLNLGHHKIRAVVDINNKFCGFIHEHGTMMNFLKKNHMTTYGKPIKITDYEPQKNVFNMKIEPARRKNPPQNNKTNWY
jgi:hypothetical protein